MTTKPVLELIADRLFALHNGAKIDDGAKLCLAVEGGAMRGIISMGMLLALYDLDIIAVFDSYVGVSAGSLNLAYALAGQGALGLSVYFEDMTDKDIVNLLRFRSEEHPIIDMRKIYDHTTKNKRLDIEKLKEKYGSSFRVSVINVNQNKGELISLDQAGHRFEEFLMAGALLPFIAGDPWIINNTEYYDGGLYYIDPSQAARELGSTHTLVLNTRTQDKPLKPWNRLLERRIKNLDDRYPGLGTHYLQDLRAYFDTYNPLPYGETELDGLKMYRHSLPHSVGVGRLTKEPEKLIGGLKMGYQSILDIFYPQGRAGILPTLM